MNSAQDVLRRRFGMGVSRLARPCAVARAVACNRCRRPGKAPGVGDVHVIEPSIHAGASYLDTLMAAAFP